MNLENFIRIFVFYLLINLACFNVYAKDKIILATNWLAQAEHGGFYQALANNYYSKYDLDVTIRPGGPGVNTKALLVAGKVDFNIGGSAGSLNFVKNDIPFKVVAAIFQKDPQVLISHPNQGNDRINDFKNKKILISKFNKVTFWPFLKTKFGFKDEQIKPYNFSLQPFLEDLTSIQQGYVTSEPYSIKKVTGSRPIVNLLADYGYMPYATTIETSDELINSNPELVQRFVDASIEGWYSYLFDDPAPGNKLIKKDNKEMTDDLLIFARQEMINRGIVISGQAKKEGIGAMSDERWKSFYELMRDQNLYPSDMNYKKAYTLKFINTSKWIEFNR